MNQNSHLGNPFRGLRPFEQDEAALYFGRTEQIAELSGRLRRHRFVAVIGASGTGKSSLVRAGLIPTLVVDSADLAPSGWRVTVMRPGLSPTLRLARTLQNAFGAIDVESVHAELGRSSAGLANFAIRHLAVGEGLLIVVDQFEELFRYQAGVRANEELDDVTPFVKLLLAASGHSNLRLPAIESLPVYVVITMRSDFFGECSRFRGLTEAINESQYLVPHLTRRQQREVIEGPIRLVGAEIEPALVQRLLNDLGDEPDQLPVLQHALMRTWDMAQHDRERGAPIAMQHYDSIGSLANALNSDADEVLASLDDQNLEIARLLFKRLVEVGPRGEKTRRPTPLSEIVAVTEKSERAILTVLQLFRARGFITLSGDADSIIDITHESLVRCWARLGDWVKEESDSATSYRRVAETAELWRQGEAALLIDPQLSLTLNWLAETKPNEAWASRYSANFPETIEFIEQSRNQVTEKQRVEALKRARRTAMVLGLLLLLAVGATTIAFSQWRRALAERDHSNRLLYDGNIYFAQRAVAEGRIRQARVLINQLTDAGLRELRGFEWFYYWGLLHNQQATLTGHPGFVSYVAFSPDGRMLASAGTNGPVMLWDVAARKQSAKLSENSVSAHVVEFSPDGKIIATGGDDATVRLWDTASRNELASLSGHSGDVIAIVFSPDGKSIASASRDKTVKLWDIKSRAELATLSGTYEYGNCLAFSPDGKIIAAQSASSSLKLWDAISHVQLAELSDASVPFAFTPDGKVLATESNHRIKLWDVSSRKEITILFPHLERIMLLAFSPDGKTLATVSDDAAVRLWDITSQKQLATLSGHSGHISSFAFSPDGMTLATGSWDHTIGLWDLTSRSDVSQLRGHAAPITFVTISPDGKTLASASEDKTVKLWDLGSRTELATLAGHSALIYSVAFSPDGQMLASAGKDHLVKLWNVGTHREIATLSGYSNEVSDVAFSPDGRILATVSLHLVKLWDVATRRELALLTSDTMIVGNLAFSPDGTQLALSGSDVELWDISSRQILKRVRVGYASSVAFSPDGKTIAATSSPLTQETNRIAFWRIDSDTKIFTLSNPAASTQVRFAPDGKTLVSAGEDGSIRLWDTVSGNELCNLSNQSDQVRSVAFSADGKMLAAATGKTVSLWFRASDAEITAFTATHEIAPD